MKLLIDTCISGTVRDALQAAGHDAVWTGDWPQDPGDNEILDHAHQQNRILIFGQGLWRTRSCSRAAAFGHHSVGKLVDTTASKYKLIGIGKIFN